MLSSVYVKEVPDLTITLSTDWVAIGSMVVTVIIVVLAAWFQVHQAKMLAKQTKKQMEAEQDLRRRQFIAQSRREWIATLRGEISSLLTLSSQYDTYLVSEYYKAWHKSPNEVKQEALRTSIALNNNLKSIIDKIELLITPEKEAGGEFKGLENIELRLIEDINALPIKLEEFRELFEQYKEIPIHMYNDISLSIVELYKSIKNNTRVLLKSEWEKIKNLED